MDPRQAVERRDGLEDSLRLGDLEFEIAGRQIRQSRGITQIAGDDHDFEEVNHTHLLNRQSEIVEIKYKTNPQLELPIAELSFTDYTELHRAKEELKEALGQSDFTPGLYDLLESSYTSEDNYVSAFSKFMAKITENSGLVFFSPGDKEAKKMALPFFKQIIERQEELHKIVTATNSAIQKQGYHVQVEKPDNATFMFYNLEGRKPILREGDNFKVGDRLFTKDELIGCLEKHPHRFSPDVMTRPVLQSFLFPVLSQKGGPAEIAYLAQINPIFEFFNLAPPFHKPRATATLLEKRFEKLMKEFDIGFTELSSDIEQIINRVLAKSFPQDIEEQTKELRNEIKEKIKKFSDQSLKFDPSLEKFADQITGKIDFQLNAFEEKLFSSHKKKSQETKDKIYRLRNALYPARKFQERTLNINYFIARYGFQIIDFIYDALDSEETAHQVIRLSEYKN